MQLFLSITLEQKVWPLVYAVLLSSLSFAGLRLMAFPAIIPPPFTLFKAHAWKSSLLFRMTFIGALIPIMLFEKSYHYVVFSRKIGLPAELDWAVQ